MRTKQWNRKQRDNSSNHNNHNTQTQHSKRTTTITTQVKPLGQIQSAVRVIWIDRELYEYGHTHSTTTKISNNNSHRNSSQRERLQPDICIHLSGRVRPGTVSKKDSRDENKMHPKAGKERSGVVEVVRTNA